MLENKKIFILGMARSGYEVAKLLVKDNKEIVITDQKEQDKDKLAELEKLGIKFIKSSEPESILDESFDVLIKNPAVFPYHPCVEKARNLKIPIVNEMEVAYHYLPKEVKIIGITGSNGKTTTTTLVYEVLKKAGISVKLGGNIGTPLSQIVKEVEPKDIVLLEISDHQLIDFKDFKTDISILTNICPTHLDYHGSYEAYQKTKKKIFNHHTNKDIAIINKKSIDAYTLTQDIKSSKYYFNDEINYIKDNGIYVNNKLVIDTKDIILKGEHNYENILTMLVLMDILKVDFKYAREVLKEFKGVEHRIEFVRECDKVKYYNDSKSTNPTATVTALKSFASNIHLILGGMDRNQEFEELIPYKNRIKKIYAIGEVRGRIGSFAQKNEIDYEEYEFLKEALASIKKQVKENDIVLLSPGSASWDQYAKFEDRGQEFKDIVNKF